MSMIHDAIDDAFRALSPERPRAYVGASSVGNPCDVYLALSHRGLPDSEVDPQLKRIFRDGHRIEDMVIEDLRMAGYKIKTRGEDGKQFEFRSGHLVGHVDGIIEVDGREYVLEIKSMNDSKFKLFKTQGVAESHPLYRVQCIALAGMAVKDGAWLVAYCKNNSMYWSEFVPFDSDIYNEAVRRAEIAVSGDVERISDDPGSKHCSGCFKRVACWSPSELFIEPSCRSCGHAIGDSCDLHGDQIQPCEDWEVWRP